MTNTTKPVTRRTVAPHSKHGRRIVVELGPGDLLGFRLERESQLSYLTIERLYDLAELVRAKAGAGGGLDPCKDPLRARNV